MLFQVVSILIINILLTILFEGVIALIFGVRSRLNQAIIALINICSNLILNTVLFISKTIANDFFLGNTTEFLIVLMIVLELTAVFIEAFLYFKNVEPKKSYGFNLLMSFMMNLFSVGLGLLVYSFIL